MEDSQFRSQTVCENLFFKKLSTKSLCAGIQKAPIGSHLVSEIFKRLFWLHFDVSEIFKK